MSVCCEVCQHPACWKAELDIERSLLLNEYGYFNVPVYYENRSSCRYDARNECIVPIDGSLPTYKTLDLLECGFPSHDVKKGAHIPEVGPDCHLPVISSGKEDRPASRNGGKHKRNASFPFASKTLAAYLEKLSNRHKEVEKQESKGREELSNGKHIVFKTLRIEDVQSFGDEYTKVYTWIPGEKSHHDSDGEEGRESKEKVVALKMIDGADLLGNPASNENKHRQKLRSQTAGLSFRRKTGYNIPPGTEDPDDYIQLLRYIDLTRQGYNKTSMNNQDVRVPSPLQTARVKLYESSDESKTPRHAYRPRHSTLQTDSAVLQTESADGGTDQTVTRRSKTMYIKDGVVLSKSPGLKKPPERSKTSKRRPLPLTRVSVPKKAVKKLPLFDHCSSSIKKTDLPEITMQPITSSENTSVTSFGKSSANASSAGQEPDVLRHSTLSSPDMVRVPATSPLSTSSELSTSPPIYRMEKGSPALYNIPSEGFMGSTIEAHKSPLLTEGRNFVTTETAHQAPEKDLLEQLPKSGQEASEGDSPTRLYLDFDGEHKLHAGKSQIGTRVAPSAIMISKASKPARCEIPVPRRQSPTLSVGSKGSLDGWLLDKDIITRTYDKYQSFSPFKTPHCSAHVIRDDLSRNMESHVSPSRRKILPPSLHNLDQYLPGEEDSLKTNTSFTTRCLSPSRSMFIKQQKQPPIENVPSEITVSRFPLLPAITRSQRSPRGDAFGHKENGTGVVYPDSPRSVELVTSFVDDDYEEEIEEVLLKKEAFSSFQLNCVNTSPQLESSDQQVTLSDPEVMNNGSSSSPTDLLDSNVKPEMVMSSLDVSNRDERRPSQCGSNFLLLPNQGSNIVITTSQHEDDYSTFNSDDVTSTVVDDNEMRRSSPQVTSNDTCVPNEDVDRSDTCSPNEDVDHSETALSLNEGISVTGEVVTEEHVSDENSKVGENIETFDELVTGTSGEVCKMYQEDTGDCADQRSLSREGSPKPPTPITCDDNLSPNSLIPTSDQVIASDSNEIRSTSPSEVKSVTPVQTSETTNEKPMEDQGSDGINDIDVGDKPFEQQMNTEYDGTAVNVDEMTEINVETETNVVNQIDSKGKEVTLENNEIRDDLEVIESSVDRPEKKSIENSMASNVQAQSVGPSSVISDTESKQTDEILDHEASQLSVTKQDLGSKRSNVASRLNLSSVDMFHGSTAHLADEPINSVMKDIFNTQLKEKSSLYLTPSHADDFTEGLELDLEVEEEIVRAIHGLEEFVLDSYEVEEEN